MTDEGEKKALRAGRYIVVGVLGAGAQGKTLDAVDKREGRPVAIKRFDVSGAKSWKDVELAEREARVLASLSHPKLPKYVEHFEEDGVLYLVMEKIEGTPLSVLRKRGSLPEGDVVRLLDDAREVLRYLHSRAPAVIHRDLKPANVIRRPDGSFAFVDFGAVRDRMRPEGGSTVVGTFGYMAPEQFQGRAGPGSDVYSMGATALALLTGNEPESLPHRGLAFDLDQALGSRVDRGLRDALAAMVEPDPDRRATSIPSIERDPLASTGAKRDRESARAKWRAAREAQRAAQRERRLQRRRRRRSIPWIARVPLTLALVVAHVVLVFVRVVVTLALTMLSLLFGARLRDASRAVDAAIARASSAIQRAIGRIEGGDVPVEPSADEPVRVGEHERIRVDPALDDKEPEEQREDADDEPAARRRRG